MDQKIQQEIDLPAEFRAPAPPRPSEDDPRIADMVIDKLLPELVEYCGDGHGETDRESIRKDVRKAIDHAHWPRDGYQIAKYLDDLCHWGCDSELVEILRDVEISRNDAHRGLVKAWVKEHGITLTLPTGAAVRVKVREGEFDGIVAERQVDEARYTVRIAALGHVGPGQIGTQGRILTKEEVECSNA